METILPIFDFLFLFNFLGGPLSCSYVRWQSKLVRLSRCKSGTYPWAIFTFIFLQFRTKIKKNAVFFIFFTSPVLEMFNLFEILWTL